MSIISINIFLFQLTMGNSKAVKTKVKRDEDFIPPDGGWGWMIVVAAGFSNVSFSVYFNNDIANNEQNIYFFSNFNSAGNRTKPTKNAYICDRV